MTGKKFLLIGVAFVALLAGLLVANRFTSTPNTTALVSGTRLPQAREIADFQLTDQHAALISKKNWQGKWTLVFPGFTTCPDVCPTTLRFLQQLRVALGPEAQKLRIVFLSVDPDRDTPERLNSYVRFFDPNFVAVTAPEPRLAALAKSLSVIYTKVPGKTPDSYTMDHSAALVLLDPQVRVAAFFTPPFQRDPMVQDLRALLAE